nr:glycine--tRNA ligase subunit beta [Suttonella ornithocola]
MNFLLEIATEELPTAAVQQLSEAGTQLWAEQLIENGFNCESIKAFATPRRLAWRMRNLSEKQVPQIWENQGPSLKVAKDADGNWTRAAIGFAKGCGLNSPDELSTIETPKGTHLFYREERPSATFEEKLPEIFEAVIHKLPIAKRMRWGDNEQSFVRPVNALVALADDKVLPLEFFGLQSGRETQGHRVHHPTPVVISHADNYEADLAEAYVIVDSEARRQEIISQVQAVANKVGGKAVMPEALIDEVAALTEYPQAIYGEFEARFLDVPQDVLITTMQDNQKTFAVVDEKGKLLPCFIAVANLISEHPELVSMGNERVIRPRFADAEFFWHQDLKYSLSERLPKLENVVYQEKLGSIADKSRRVAKIAAYLTELTEADKDKVQQAAELAKCDLLSEMVMEFPELQGYMAENMPKKKA